MYSFSDGFILNWAWVTSSLFVVFLLVNILVKYIYCLMLISNNYIFCDFNFLRIISKWESGNIDWIE